MRRPFSQQAPSESGLLLQRFCVVALPYATSSDHCIIVDQPRRIMATSRLRYRLSSGTPSESSFSIVQFWFTLLPSDLAPVLCRGFLY